MPSDQFYPFEMEAGFLGVVTGIKQNDVCEAGSAWSMATVSRGDRWMVCCHRLGRKGETEPGGVWTWRAVMKVLFSCERKNGEQQ